MLAFLFIVKLFFTTCPEFLCPGPWKQTPKYISCPRQQERCQQWFSCTSASQPGGFLHSVCQRRKKKCWKLLQVHPHAHTHFWLWSQWLPMLTRLWWAGCRGRLFCQQSPLRGNFCSQGAISKLISILSMNMQFATFSFLVNSFCLFPSLFGPITDGYWWHELHLVKILERVPRFI